MLPSYFVGNPTWPEELMAHGVNSGDVIRPHIAIIDGCLWLSDPISIILVCMGSNLTQQPQFGRLGLIITPGGKIKNIRA